MAVNPLTTNLTGITTKATAAASLASLVLVSPTTTNPSSTVGYQPLNTPSSTGIVNTLLSQPPYLLFNYEGEQIATLESDITDHWVEDNIYVQDQIALKPEEFTTKGYIGELTDILPAFLQPLQTAANALVTIDSYTPQLSVTALNALNQATLLYENASAIASAAVSAWSSITSSIFGGPEEIGTSGSGVFVSGSSLVQSKQQQMFAQLYGYWNTRTLFNIQTPWAVFTNMAIKSLRAIQDAETRMITDFEITFKKIRNVSSIDLTETVLSPGTATTQSASAVNLGTSPGVPGSSLGSGITTGLA